MKCYLEIAIAGFFFKEAQHVLEEDLQVDFLSLGVHMLGKTQQTMRYGSAAFDRFKHGIHQPDHPFFRRKLVGKGKQVFVEARLFPDDSQRIVDFVSHPCGQSANGCHFVGVFHLVVHDRTSQIRLVSSIDHVLRAAENDCQYEGNADCQKQDKVTSQGQPTYLQRSWPAQKHQHERGMLNESVANDEGSAFFVLGLQYFCVSRYRGHWQRTRFQRLAIKPRRSLKHPFLVDEKRIIGGVHSQGPYLAYDFVGVDGRAQHELGSRICVETDSDDEVGQVSVASKHIADIDATQTHLVEPILFLVVLALEVIGPGVAHLPARAVDQAEIDESTKSSLHSGQERVEFLWVLQICWRFCLDNQRKG